MVGRLNIIFLLFFMWVLVELDVVVLVVIFGVGLFILSDIMSGNFMLTFIFFGVFMVGYWVIFCLSDLFFVLILICESGVLWYCLLI